MALLGEGPSAANHRRRIISDEPLTTDHRQQTLGDHRLIFDLLRHLPGEALATEMTKAAGSLVDRLAQLQFVDDLARSQVEVVLYYFQQFLVALRARAVREDGQRDRLGDADRIRDLEQTSLAQASLHQ